MNIALFSVVLNIHQVNIADELYELTEHNFVFVELERPRRQNKKGGGDDLSSRPYLLQAWKNPDNDAKAMDLACNADIAIFGGHMAFKYQIQRLKRHRLTFEMGERWLKHWKSLLSPRLLNNILNYHLRGWKKEPLYKLCSSAYAVNDQYLLGTFKERCYKWGYFTKVEDVNIESLTKNHNSDKTTMMWCARFLKWKHPELVIQLAQRLKENGHDVQIDMYGTGVEQPSIKALCKRLNVQDIVTFKDNVSNNEILQAMRNHDIFLFTSDRNEGWGAVLNEAMSNGCAVVASNEIGSVPYLIKNEKNGLIFKSKDIDSLCEKVTYLIENPLEKNTMAAEAYRTMAEIWSPHNAAVKLLQLAYSLAQKQEPTIQTGPCSKALPQKQ